MAKADSCGGQHVKAVAGANRGSGKDRFMWRRGRGKFAWKPVWSGGCERDWSGGCERRL